MRFIAPVLVMGSAGRLGREIVLLLRHHGYSVVGVDLAASPTTDVVLDICDAAAVSTVLQEVSAVVHTAALHGRHYDLRVLRLDFVRTNVEGTLNLLNACVAHGIRKLLYTSTTSIYGQAMVHPDQAVWVTEELVPQPRDIYDITKQAAEVLCRDFFEKEGQETTVLRVARFLPEPANLATNHRLYRGLNERDGAQAHLLALEKSFTTFEVSSIAAGSPFERPDVVQLKHDPAPIICRRPPEADGIYQQLGWQYRPVVGQRPLHHRGSRSRGVGLLY